MLWWDTICKEMCNVWPAFKAFEGDKSQIPRRFQQIGCHIIFNMKIGENIRRKACFVAGGHTTEMPTSLTYSSVVSCDSVQITLTIAGLNNLKVMACGIQNVYLTAPCREEIWTYAGPEFGSEAGTIMYVRKDLYGLKSSGVAFEAHLIAMLHDIGSNLTKADPDLWFRLVTKPDGFEYYKYALC